MFKVTYKVNGKSGTFHIAAGTAQQALSAAIYKIGKPCYMKLERM